MRRLTKTIERFVKKVVTASSGDSVASAAHLMEQHNVGAVIVVEHGKPVGIVTDRDLALELGAHNLPREAPLARIMRAPVQTINRDDGVFDTSQAMLDAGVRRLPVVDDDGLLLGLVTLDDLLRVLSRELSNLTEGIKSEMAVR